MSHRRWFWRGVHFAAVFLLLLPFASLEDCEGRVKGTYTGLQYLGREPAHGYPVVLGVLLGIVAWIAPRWKNSTRALRGFLTGKRSLLASPALAIVVVFAVGSFLCALVKADSPTPDSTTPSPRPPR